MSQDFRLVLWTKPKHYEEQYKLEDFSAYNGLSFEDIGFYGEICGWDYIYDLFNSCRKEDVEKFLKKKDLTHPFIEDLVDKLKNFKKPVFATLVDWNYVEGIEGKCRSRRLIEMLGFKKIFHFTNINTKNRIHYYVYEPEKMVVPASVNKNRRGDIYWEPMCCCGIVSLTTIYNPKSYEKECKKAIHNYIQDVLLDENESDEACVRVNNRIVTKKDIPVQELLGFTLIPKKYDVKLNREFYRKDVGDFFIVGNILAQLC